MTGGWADGSDDDDGKDNVSWTAAAAVWGYNM
jgi:hypothetical protein